MTDECFCCTPKIENVKPYLDYLRSKNPQALTEDLLKDEIKKINEIIVIFGSKLDVHNQKTVEHKKTHENDKLIILYYTKRLENTKAEAAKTKAEIDNINAELANFKTTLLYRMYIRITSLLRSR